MTIGKKNTTLKKQQVKESKLLATGVKSIKFWYEAAGGETNIPFSSINAGSTPASISSNGLINPSSTEILAANLGLFHTNVEVFSSINQKLMEGLTYVVSNSQIKFVNGYTATEDEIFEVNYKNDVITGTNVVDARPLTATGTLVAGNIDFNVGETFKTNAYPNTQLGEVLVFVDGEVQYRNVANATADPSADGNYEEVHAANGYGTLIRFNESYVDDKPIIVISRNLIAERPDISMMQLIENLGGQLDRVIESVAALDGVDITEFQVAPNQIDLKAFGDRILSLENTITTLQNTEVISDIETQSALLTNGSRASAGTISNFTLSESNGTGLVSEASGVWTVLKDNVVITATATGQIQTTDSRMIVDFTISGTSYNAGEDSFDSGSGYRSNAGATYVMNTGDEIRFDTDGAGNINAVIATISASYGNKKKLKDI